MNARRIRLPSEAQGPRTIGPDFRGSLDLPAPPRRINIQHRLVYQVIEEEKTVKVIRMWTHYD